MATIAKQTIYLNLRPGAVMPVLHVSQGDSGLEALEFKLINESQPWPIPAAVTDIQLNGTTPVGVFSYSDPTWSGNTVTANVTETMTAERGLTLCELRLFDSTLNSIGTLNFVIAVEPSPFTNAHVSTSDMAVITESLNGSQRNMLLSKSWAVGDTGMRDGEGTNNSKYWSEVSDDNGQRWATGAVDGAAVPTTDPAYHNNSKYWSEQSDINGERWSVGKINGSDVPTSDETYHNNSKWWSSISESWAVGGTNNRTGENTNNSKYWSEQSDINGERWSVGQKNGADVPSTDPAYHNNSKYWSEVSHQYANEVSYKKVYENVAEMKADADLLDGQVCRTLGYYAANDGGDALYRIYNSMPDGYYETLSNGLYAKGIVDKSSVLNWNGSTIEKKVQDFLQYATNGEKLDLKGAQINVTEGFTKTNYSYLTYCIISNAIINIPASIGGWLSIDGDSGYRSPMFENCTFIGGGAIFYENSYNFQATGCVFHDVQILNGDYIQACTLSGCNVMNRNAYLIECNWAFDLTLTNCTFEAGNKGVFYGKGNSDYASITHGAFNACVFEGFTDAVFKTNGATAVNFENCYVEKVPYLMYDSKAFRDVFYASIRGGFIDNRYINNKFTVYSDATYPFLNVSDLQFNGDSSHYLCNLNNANRIITSSNRGEKYLFGANGGKNELIKNNYTFNGTKFSFTTVGDSIYQQPQSFLLTIAAYSNTPILLTKVSILTLNYRPSTNGFVVTETPLVQNSSMSVQITWTAVGNALGKVTITGESSSTVSISIVNLGAVMNGMIT